MYTDLVNQFANRFAEGAVEFSMGMMADCPSDYTTFKDASATLQDSITDVCDTHLEDYLNEFCEAVRAAIKQRQVRVKDITIDGEGFQTATYFIETLGVNR